jgi:hypothetical protein
MTAATTFARLLVVVAALAFAAAGPVRPAAAGTPCWKALLNDWYDGRIDKTYAVSCYRQALSHLPPDVTTYSSARDDIQRELQSAIYRSKHGGKPAAPSAVTTAADPAAAPQPGTGATTTTAAGQAPTVQTPRGRHAQGGFAKVAGRFNPGSADSLPLPLLVLAGLAVLLIAAGGVGAVVRRRLP